MKYVSTRGGIEPVSFAEAVMMGLATDGGLLLPQSIPQVDDATLTRWAALSMPELAVEVIKPFVGDDIPEDDLAELLTRSFSTFTHTDVTPVVDVGDRHVLELFHGPTLAFKDVALQFLGNLFEYLLARSGGKLNIIGATSGDTGSAAIYGVRGKDRINIFILHPHKKVSLVQERQMTSVLDANVHNIAFRGAFDDGQSIVKALFNDLDFKAEHHLGAVNSINWARVMAQITYYFYAWGRVTGGDPGKKTVFSVPTGNFGDIFAGYMAQRMGLPVEKLILATNRNDILHRFVQTGTYSPGGREVAATMSPSMDIQVASNFERYLYYLMDEDAAAIQSLMADFSRDGKLSVSAEKLTEAHKIFTSAAVSEEETIAIIRETHAASGYVLDPHTAVGFKAADGHPGAVCLSTAHPAKFGAAVEEATGKTPDLPPAFADLLERDHRCAVLEADVDAVKAFMLEKLGG